MHKAVIIGEKTNNFFQTIFLMKGLIFIKSDITKTDIYKSTMHFMHPQFNTNVVLHISVFKTADSQYTVSVLFDGLTDVESSTTVEYDTELSPRFDDFFNVFNMLLDKYL